MTKSDLVFDSLRSATLGWHRAILDAGDRLLDVRFTSWPSISPAATQQPLPCLRDRSDRLMLAGATISAISTERRRCLEPMLNASLRAGLIC